MARTAGECLFPEDAAAVPVIPIRSKPEKVCGLQAQPVQESKRETNLPSEQAVYAGIQLIRERKDWNKYPGWQEAISKELSGILENGIWNYEEVVPREVLMRSKEPMHVGRLMTIVSVKRWETPELRRLTARIVFRGDDIRDQDNNLAALREAKANPSALAGNNANLAFGCLKGK